ncbi:MAG: hypothetical protein IH606_19225 [Burkholderiales bacterium]|nr:hypothetical protein [Burkholderiales bacterium]
MSMADDYSTPCRAGASAEQSLLCPHTAWDRNGADIWQAHNWPMCSEISVMRVIALLALLGAASGIAQAGWVEVGGNELATTYADAQTIRKSGSTARMWHLIDYTRAKEIAGMKPYRSTKIHDEYDCANDRKRTLSISLHSANMGEGGVLGTVTAPGEWRQVLPDTLVETLRAFACGKW